MASDKKPATELFDIWAAKLRLVPPELELLIEWHRDALAALGGLTEEGGPQGHDNMAAWCEYCGKTPGGSEKIGDHKEDCPLRAGLVVLAAIPGGSDA